MGDLLWEIPYGQVTELLTLLKREGLTSDDIPHLWRSDLARHVVGLIKAREVEKFLPPIPPWEELASLVQNAKKPIQFLNLSVRAENALATQGIRFVWQLLPHEEEQVLTWRNLGKGCLKEIKDRLSAVHLQLGMRLPKDEPPSE